MRVLWGSVLAVALALGSIGCGSSSDGGGGEVNSEAALRAFMQTVAFDLAEVLAEIAPGDATAAEKAPGEVNTTACPQGGEASWTESPSLGGGGTLTLSQCAMRGVHVTGDLGGYLESQSGYVTATALVGLEPLIVGGNYSASLTVLRLDLSADIPPTDFLTYWRIEAYNEEGVPLCAWSGSASCTDEMTF